MRDFRDPENTTVQPYREGKLPFVLTGAIDHWKHAYEHWTLEYFAEQYPNAFVEHYSRNMYRESVKPTFMDLWMVPYALFVEMPLQVFLSLLSIFWVDLLLGFSNRAWKLLKQLRFIPC